jgi:plasmid stabilization system protein ParE
LKYKLKYSPDASDRLHELDKEITNSHGKPTAHKIISNITKTIRGLQDTPEKGVSVESLLGIPTPYRFLHVEHNYVFYKIENNTILVTAIYNERENFMWKMFRINLRTQDSIDFWGE